MNKSMLRRALRAARTTKEQQEPPGSLLNELRADAEAVRKPETAIRLEQKRHDSLMEPEYWTCIVFESREQKLAVLRALGLPAHEDKYIDGNAFIRALKLPVPEETNPRHRLRQNKTWAELAK
jgi:hypothetical protein